MQNKQNVKNVKNVHNVRNVQKMQNMQNRQNMQTMHIAQNMLNMLPRKNIFLLQRLFSFSFSIFLLLCKKIFSFSSKYYSPLSHINDQLADLSLAQFDLVRVASGTTDPAPDPALVAEPLELYQKQSLDSSGGYMYTLCAR